MSINDVESMIIVMGLGLITIIVSLIFTKLPAKSKDWFETEERIK